MSEPPRQHHNVTLVILALACTAFAIQQTMVIPALPVLQRQLHTSTTWATWVLTVFLLVACVATPIIGKLGDQYGKERLLAISLLVFLFGCIGCAVAWNVASLIGFRALAGVGGGAARTAGCGRRRCSTRAARSVTPSLRPGGARVSAPIVPRRAA